MSNSYKFYSDTKDIMKKYVNATEGAIIYGISKSRWQRSMEYSIQYFRTATGKTD